MKNASLYSGIVTGLIVMALLMRVAHIRYGNLFLTLTFVLAIAFQAWHIFQLEKLLKTPSATTLLRRLSSFLVICAVSVKIMHIPYADILLLSSLLFSLLINGRHIKILKEKLAEENTGISE